MANEIIRFQPSLDRIDPCKLLENALLEYVVRYGFTDKAKAALRRLDSEVNRG